MKDGICKMHGGNDVTLQKCSWTISKGRNRFRDLCVDERIILNWVLKKEDVCIQLTQDRVQTFVHIHLFNCQVLH
jgi:hypothetical protein